jgi:hypothetical protein
MSSAEFNFAKGQRGGRKKVVDVRIEKRGGFGGCSRHRRLGLAA